MCIPIFLEMLLFLVLCLYIYTLTESNDDNLLVASKIEYLPLRENKEKNHLKKKFYDFPLGGVISFMSYYFHYKNTRTVIHSIN